MSYADLNQVRVGDEEFGADFFADDLCADVVLPSQPQPHLLENESHFFLLLHRAKRLNLKKSFVTSQPK